MNSCANEGSITAELNLLIASFGPPEVLVVDRGTQGPFIQTCSGHRKPKYMEDNVLEKIDKQFSEVYIIIMYIYK